MPDWAAFENLLAKPDAEYEIAFRLFDVGGTGKVKYDDFQRLYNLNKGESSIPFDWNGEWATLYIGSRKQRHDMTYPQFSQMLRGLQGERVRQAFHKFDRDGDGYIEPGDFQRIILETSKHKLSDHILENLPSLCNISTGSRISYANVRAFLNVIREMDLIDYIIRTATSKSADGKISRSDFLNEAARIARFSLFTPMEADILFHFAGFDKPSGRLAFGDFGKVLDSSWREPFQSPIPTLDADSNVTSFKTNVLNQVLESLHHFGLGSIAGAIGAFVVYPIDLVKTRMQNQRSQRVGERLYKNSIDCATKVIRNEGFRGLYSGVLPQLVGVAPEKAIKLTVNDLVRGKFTEKQTGRIWWPHELLAGGSAGACQVVRTAEMPVFSGCSHRLSQIFTNPLEIVKIRLQVQGEVAKSATAAPRRSAMWIVKNLGLVGLYKGASACLLRDGMFPDMLSSHDLDIDSWNSPILRHLLPNLQPHETRLFRRKPDEEARHPTSSLLRSHRRHASRLLHHPLRRHKDPSAGRGSQGRDPLQRSASLRRNHLQGRGSWGFLQGRSGARAAIVTTVRLHPRRVRGPAESPAHARQGERLRH